MKSLLLILATMALLATGCTSPLGSGVERLNRDQLERAAALQLPASAEVLSARYVSFQDSYLSAVIRLPANDLQTFLADSGFGEPTPGLRTVVNNDLCVSHRDGNDPPDPTREDPAWDPDAASEVAGIDQTAEPVDGVYRKLMIDTGAAQPVIYLVAFTT